MERTVKVITESVKNQLINAVVKLVSEHQLTASNLEDIIQEVNRYMSDNAVIEKKVAVPTTTCNKCDIYGPTPYRSIELDE